MASHHRDEDATSQNLNEIEWINESQSNLRAWR
jgi:hypothetical protein